ncbi:hypothetical protein [Serratia proteamaculans]
MKIRYQALVAPLSALVLLSGCVAVGPDYTPPPLSSSAFPSGFADPAAGLSSGQVEVQWWRTFEEPALTRLVQQALAANHDIGIAAARLEEA